MTLVSLSLAAFAGFAITWQFLHHDRDAILRDWVEHDRNDGGENEIVSSVAQSYLRVKQFAAVSDIVKRDELITLASGWCRYVDLILPNDARVFMTDMTGPTNLNKAYYYFYATYYLFPREVGVSVDQPAHLTERGFPGRTAESDQEILTNGYDAIIDFPPDGNGTLTVRFLRPPREFPIKEPVTPVWFSSNFDTVVAFLLPLLTALAGMWLFRFLFPVPSGQMPLFEQLACGLGLGMMAVAAITLGVKLCGFHGWGVIFLVTAACGIAEIWHNRKAYLTGITGGFRKMVSNPIVAAPVAAGFLVFLILFRLAGLEGLIDGDAVRWALKAKIIHFFSGNEIVQWFSNPRLAHAHLDYPTLVPSLHAATYDSIGHVDEFVTKFWPTWMLLFLIAALASLNRGGKRWFRPPHWALLGLLLLPATQKFVQMEGSTMPMIFFTVMGCIQCAFWLVGKDRARLGLGLTLLFGAAMAKFEGLIFLALVGSWMLLLPSARPSLKPSPRTRRVLVFCFLAALPFICLRVQLPSLEYESGWAGYALHNPGITLSNWPGIFLMMFARLFVNPAFAHWSGESGQFHWIGRWDGLSSLYNHSTLGLPWLCLLMTAALWFALPARRQVIVWILAMFVGITAALSGVFVSFVNITSLTQVISYTTDNSAGRYLLPVLLAWFATILTMFFMNPPLSAPATGREATAPLAPVAANPSTGGS